MTIRRWATPGVICAVLASAVLAGQAASPTAQQATPPTPVRDPGRATAQEPATPTAQDQPVVTFRSSVSYVEVDATVIDKDGKVVTDLTRDDFEVTENGRAQAIDTFSLITLPTTVVKRPIFADRTVEADVQSNGGADGRLYVLVMDDLHVEASRTPRTREIARDFIAEHFRPNDIGAVLFTSGSSRRGQDFTSSRRLLLAAVDRFMGDAMPTLTEERMNRAARMPGGMGSRAKRDDTPTDEAQFREKGLDGAVDAQRVPRLQRTLTTLRQTSEFLAGVRGRRKALMFFSEGLGYDLGDIGENSGSRFGGAVGLEIHEAIAAATRGNVRYYTVDPRGTATLDMMPERSSLTSTGDGGTIEGVSARANETRLAQDSLRSLAVNTGGTALVNRSSFDDAYEQIVTENSTYFVLGYSSDNENLDGKFRKVSVKVKRPGLRVRARGGYYASRGGAPINTVYASGILSLGALVSPLVLNELPMRMFAAPFRRVEQAANDKSPLAAEGEASPAAGSVPTPLTSVAVAAEVDVSQLMLTPTDGETPVIFDAILMATDANGGVYPGPFYSTPLALSYGAAARVRANRLRLWSHIQLAPGRYQLRLASAAAGKIGSVLFDLDVPDFDAAPLSMSGIALSSGAAVNTLTLADKDRRSDMPGAPMASREFSVDEELSMFVELYQQTGAKRHDLELVTELRTQDGKVARKVVTQRGATESPSITGGQAFNPRIPLAGLAPGSYLVRVEARADGERKSVMREVGIEIVP